jgi:hypothetical protein
MAVDPSDPMTNLLVSGGIPGLIIVAGMLLLRFEIVRNLSKKLDGLISELSKERVQYAMFQSATVTKMEVHDSAIAELNSTQKSLRPEFEASQRAMKEEFKSDFMRIHNKNNDLASVLGRVEVDLARLEGWRRNEHSVRTRPSLGDP